MDRERRSEVVKVRVTPGEKAALRAAAGDRPGRVTVADLFREQMGAMLGGPVPSSAALTGETRPDVPARDPEALTAPEVASERPSRSVAKGGKTTSPESECCECHGAISYPHYHRETADGSEVVRVRSLPTAAQIQGRTMGSVPRARAERLLAAGKVEWRGDELWIDGKCW